MLNPGELKAQPLTRRLDLSHLVLLVGALVLAVPTMIQVARISWSTEQGGHGPIVLATGLWLLWREGKGEYDNRQPPPLWRPALLMGLALGIFTLARILGILEIESFAMYGALLAGVYAIWGGHLFRKLWFPFLYLALMLPPPDTVVAALTQPLKIAISEWAVSLLHWFGYPIANSGVTIQIAQFELLVAAACAGLNSIISLSAVCLFYAYLMHQSDFRYILLLALAILPVAIFSNLVRVIILVLITYYLGEAAGQGFLHDFAGLTMFAVALISIFALDRVLHPLVSRLWRRA